MDRLNWLQSFLDATSEPDALGIEQPTFKAPRLEAPGPAASASPLSSMVQADRVSPRGSAAVLDSSPLASRSPDSLVQLEQEEGQGTTLPGPGGLAGCLVMSTSIALPTCGAEFLYWGLDFTPESTQRIQRLMMVRHVFEVTKSSVPSFVFRPRPYCTILFAEKCAHQKFAPFENSHCVVALQRLHMVNKLAMVVEVDVLDPLLKSMLSSKSLVFAIIAIQGGESVGHHWNREAKVHMSAVKEERQAVPPSFRKYASSSHFELGGTKATCVLRKHYRNE